MKKPIERANGMGPEFCSRCGEVNFAMKRRTLRYKEMADPMVRPRYTGIATFMRAPFSEDWSELDVALVGVPFE